MGQHLRVVYVDHTARCPCVQNSPVEALVLSREIVRWRSSVILPVQRLYGDVGAAHDEFTDRVDAVVWEERVPKSQIPKSFPGVVRLNQTYRHASLLGQRSVHCSNRHGYNGGCISVTGLGVSRFLCAEGKLTTQCSS